MIELSRPFKCSDIDGELRRAQHNIAHRGRGQGCGQPLPLEYVFIGINRTRDIKRQQKRLPTGGLSCPRVYQYRKGKGRRAAYQWPVFSMDAQGSAGAR